MQSIGKDFFDRAVQEEAKAIITYQIVLPLCLVAMIGVGVLVGYVIGKLF